ncbi:MAG: DUF2341 domain-containing protein [Myxococcota bacterium]
MRGAVVWAPLLVGGCLIDNPEYQGATPVASSSGANGTTSGARTDTAPGIADSSDDDDTEPPDTTTGGVDGTSVTATAEEETGLEVEWWDPSWSYRQRLVWADLGLLPVANLPVRVDIKVENTAMFADAGADIRFVSDAGDVLAHEIERWTDGGGIAWVAVPSVGGTDPTGVSMYYGNPRPDATIEQSPFGREMLAVWHLSNGNNAVSVNHPVQISEENVSPGVIGPAVHIVEGDQPLTIGDAGPLLQLPLGPFTFSAWVSLSEVADQAVIYSALGPEGDGIEVTINRDEQGDFITMTRSPGGGAVPFSATAMLPPPGFDDWRYVALRYEDFEDFAVFGNGVFLEVIDTTVLVDEPVMPTDGQPMLGASAEVGAVTFAGALDEVRFATTARKNAWFAADYASVRADLGELGRIEEVQ